MILFKPKFDESDAEHPEFHLTLSKKQNYDIVSGYHSQMRKPVFMTVVFRCRQRSASD